jgi:hypothetical protein
MTNHLTTMPLYRNLVSTEISTNNNKNVQCQTVHNVLPSQVDNDPEDKGQRLPVFTEEQRARLQKSRTEKAGSMTKLQDWQNAERKEERRKEWQARRMKAAQEENAIDILEELPPGTKYTAPHHEELILDCTRVS